MLDRPAATGTPLSASPREGLPRWPSTIQALAGLLGAAGVGVGAAGAHVGGGDLARTASEFLLVHAAAMVAGAAIALGPGRRSKLLASALTLLGAGAVLFGGELSVAALLDRRPLPLAAPVGGLCLIAGWLCFSAAALPSLMKRG